MPMRTWRLLQQKRILELDNFPIRPRPLTPQVDTTSNPVEIDGFAVCK